MAVTTTEPTLVEQGVGLAGLTDARRTRSDAPIQELTVKSKDFVITAGGAGNEQKVKIAYNPPQNFAYRLVDFGFAIHQAAGETINWDNVITVGMFDGPVPPAATNTYELYYPAISPGQAIFGGSSGAQVIKCYCLDCYPTQVISAAQPGTQCTFTVDAFNSTQNDVAATGNFYMRFLQYTIEQVKHWQVNTPTPVVNR